MQHTGILLVNSTEWSYNARLDINLDKSIVDINSFCDLQAKSFSGIQADVVSYSTNLNL